MRGVMEEKKSRIIEVNLDSFGIGCCVWSTKLFLTRIGTVNRAKYYGKPATNELSSCAGFRTK